MATIGGPILSHVATFGQKFKNYRALFLTAMLVAMKKDVLRFPSFDVIRNNEDK